MTTSPPTYPPDLPDPRRGYLLTAHVAALFEQVHHERTGERITIEPKTVLDYVRKSRPGGRYETRPMRGPTGYIGGDKPAFQQGARPAYWAPAEGETLADVEAELIAWRRAMPGHGVGGGRPRKTDTTRGGAR